MYIGIDLGGINIGAGIVDSMGTLIYLLFKFTVINYSLDCMAIF